MAMCIAFTHISPLLQGVNNKFQAQRVRSVRVVASAQRPSADQQKMRAPAPACTRRDLGNAMLAASTAPLWFPNYNIAFAAENVQTFEAIEGERFAPLAASFEFPETWKARPGQKPKPGKYLLYTDTYGPNYRYFANWPKLKDEQGLVVDSVEVALQGLSGLESISDLGPITALDPQKGFGLSRADLTEGTVSIQNRNVRKDAKGQVYYEWQMKTSDDAIVLVSATASGGGLYALAIGATQEQWDRVGQNVKQAIESFTVAPAEESTVDISGRIYGTKKAGGFS